MRTILILNLLFLVACSFAQDSTGVIECRIETIAGEIRHDNPLIELRICLKNPTQTNMIMYGLGNKVITNSSIDHLCNDDDVGAGLGLFIWNNHTELQYSTEQISDTLGQDALTNDKFLSAMNEATKRYLNGTRVAKHIRDTCYNVQLNLKDYRLRKESYDLQIVYFSGRGIFSKFVVGSDKIDIDKVKYNAEVFQGCAISNKIRIKLN